MNLDEIYNELKKYSSSMKFKAPPHNCQKLKSMV